MNSVFTDYLNKFKEALLGEEGFKDTICQTIKEKCGKDVKRDSVEIKGGSINLLVDPYLKTEIAFQKDEILKSLREKFPNKTIRDLH